MPNPPAPQRPEPVCPKSPTGSGHTWGWLNGWSHCLLCLCDMPENPTGLVNPVPPPVASNHAAAGCTCRPVPPSPPPVSADLKALVRQVVDAAYEVGGATLHANSALSDQQQRYWTNRRAELLDYEKRIEKELLAHVASLTARLAAAEAETERFQQAALRGIDLAEAYGADRQKAYDKIFQPQRGAP